MLTSDQIRKSLSLRHGLQFKKQLTCPHDGGTCHHSCEEHDEPSCFRETAGMNLSKPCDGYPIDSKQYFAEIIMKRVFES